LQQEFYSAFPFTPAPIIQSLHIIIINTILNFLILISKTPLPTYVLTKNENKTKFSRPITNYLFFSKIQLKELQN